ncbi:MAG: cation diffusion facilitator family transporter, partial [Bacteroidia bacterium]|nr:cation diffusion facilitator family transporter [Bacteroidia bacterium]
FGTFIGVTGYKILRKSLAGIMDESDTKLVEEIILFAQKNRKPEWIDLHNLRVIKYGAILHIDAHLTLPYYFSVREAHAQVKLFEDLIRSKYGSKVELFIHVDDCMEFSCEICTLINCDKRSRPFSKEIIWNFKNSAQNNKHNKNT